MFRHKGARGGKQPGLPLEGGNDALRATESSTVSIVLANSLAAPRLQVKHKAELGPQQSFCYDGFTYAIYKSYYRYARSPASQES
jgi:hypothetical protein